MQKERFMSDGKVKWFNPRKGYGFIATSDGRDIFVHYSSISSDGYKTLAEGDPVTFDVVEGDKGLRAENVVALAASESKEEPQGEQEPESKEES
jgi:CspA family cold shock protein